MSAEEVPLRKASRIVRRQQLIDATVAVLARKGYAAMTVADVAKEAGLSPGIVIFHFRSKDELLADTLSFLAAEYRRNWHEQLRQAGDSASERLLAVLLSDFDRHIFTRQKLAAWIAFWGETQGRPVYDQICAGPDAERLAVVEELCRTINAEGGYGVNCKIVTYSLDSLGDGLWLSLSRETGTRSETDAAAQAQKIIMTTLSSFFPGHFAVRG